MSSVPTFFTFVMQYIHIFCSIKDGTLYTGCIHYVVARLRTTKQSTSPSNTIPLVFKLVQSIYTGDAFNRATFFKKGWERNYNQNTL